MDASTAERVTGKVVEYQQRRGFGFIQPEGEDESKKVFVHWKQIQTDDRWPSLQTGMEVEFAIKEEKGRKFAESVTAVGGEKVSVGEDSDKNYNMEKKYKGKVKFYDLKKGFGFITPTLEGDETIEWGGETVDKDKGIYVAREEIITDDEPPALNDGAEVEFRLYHSSKGLGAGQITQPDGEKIVFKFTAGQKRRRDSYGGGGSWGRNRKRQRMGWGNRGRMLPPHLKLDSDQIEVGLYIENKYVGRLIGKGGESVKEIRQKSGAKVQFGDARQSMTNRQVVSVVGDADQIAKACLEIVTKLNEFGDEGRQDKLIFLIPDSFCGMFIGKGGSFLKKVREESGVKINVSNVPIQLPGGSLVSLANVIGDVSQIGEACKIVVPKLGTISKKVIESQMQALNFSW